MATVSIVLRKDKINSKGMIPVHFRIIKNRKVSYISSGFKCPESSWDDSNKRFKGKIDGQKETTSRMNGLLYHKFAEIQNEVLYLETKSRSITTKKIKNSINGVNEINFYEFADKILQKYLIDGKIGTYDKNLAILNKLKEYKSELFFEDIDTQFIHNYEYHLKAKYNNSVNTIGNNLKFIRTIINKAFEQDIIDLNQNPFLRYKIKVAKTQRDYLSEEELNTIENLDLSNAPNLALHRDMFVFSSYVGGLRISDVLKLRWEHFDGERIEFTIQKTGTQLSIKLPKKALEIIHFYSKEKNEKLDFIFPVFSKEEEYSNPRVLDSAISSSTALINKNLKLIAKKAKITKKLSFHIARHTWATRALRKGISIDKVSKLMGHAAIKETQIYAKIINSELDKAMDVFN